MGSDLRVPLVLVGLPGLADGGVPAAPRRAGSSSFPRRNMDQEKSEVLHSGVSWRKKGCWSWWWGGGVKEEV